MAGCEKEEEQRSSLPFSRQVLLLYQASLLPLMPPLTLALNISLILFLVFLSEETLITQHRRNSQTGALGRHYSTKSVVWLTCWGWMISHLLLWDWRDSKMARTPVNVKVTTVWGCYPECSPVGCRRFTASLTRNGWQEMMSHSVCASLHLSFHHTLSFHNLLRHFFTILSLFYLLSYNFSRDLNVRKIAFHLWFCLIRLLQASCGSQHVPSAAVANWPLSLALSGHPPLLSLAQLLLSRYYWIV